MEATTKRCTACGQTKPISEFYLSKRMADGHTSRCKDCHRAAARRSYKIRTITNPALNEALADFEPIDLMNELRARGYHGTLEFQEVKVRKIRL